MLGEGRWEYAVDEKGRVLIPPEIRKEFEAGGVWLIEPEGYVVLYVLSSWRRLLKGVKREDRQQFRIARQPMVKQMDPQWRMRIPEHIIKLGKLGPNIVLISMADDGYLKVLSKNGENQLMKTSNPEEPRPFQSPKEAQECLSKGKEVIYFSSNRRRVVGKLVAGAGGLFKFTGKDEKGIVVSLDREPYWSFYPRS